MIKPEDHDFFEKELESFLPDQIFDAHAHVWSHQNMLKNRTIKTLPRNGNFEEFSKMLQALHPQRTCAANVFHRICPAEYFDSANKWTSQQVKCDPNYRGLFLMSPDF